MSVAPINQRRQNDVLNCSIRLYHPYFICILKSQYKFNIYDFHPVLGRVFIFHNVYFCLYPKRDIKVMGVVLEFF